MVFRYSVPPTSILSTLPHQSQLSRLADTLALRARREYPALEPRGSCKVLVETSDATIRARVATVRARLASVRARLATVRARLA